MAVYTLKLIEDRLPGEARLVLQGLNRVLYVHRGTALVSHGGQVVRLEEGTAWHSPDLCSLTAHGRDLIVLRYELRPANAEDGSTVPEVQSRVLLAQRMTLDPSQAYLIRCDRVEFAPGGEALPHGHRGGGIRYLVAGELEIRVGAEPGRIMKPGSAWFESGVEPVHAIASRTEATAFIRVAILPRAIRGQSSIVYVNPAHARVKPRRYTVYVDEPIELA